MDALQFTEDEIREQLRKLGYTNVTQERLELFKKDLEDLVKNERSRNSSLLSNTESSASEFGSLSRPLGSTYKVPMHTRPASDAAQTTKKPENTRVLASSREDCDKVTSGSDTAAVRWDTRNPDALSQADEQHHSHDTSDVSDHRVIKRKVLRRKDGHSQVCDESVTESEADTDALYQRLGRLGVSDGRPRSAPPASHHHDMPIYRLPEDFMGPKALIRPMSVQPHQQQVKKTDPVTRYQQYQSSWRKNRAPGEKQHKDLRWNVREHMVQYDQIVNKKQHKVYVPNSYQVPTEKKRKNLRWQIRNDLAQGIMPPSMFE